MMSQFVGAQSGQPMGMPTVPKQESVSIVLGHTLTSLQEVENRLNMLCNRVLSTASVEKQPEPMNPGTLAQAVNARNIANRLQDLCNTLESII